MRQESITKLLVCLTGKPASEFNITLNSSTEFSLLEQSKEINIPKRSNINAIEQRAIIDLISILYIYHHNESFSNLTSKYPKYMSLISILEEGRMFLIALGGMSGIRKNVQYYIRKFCSILDKDISNQILILLLREEDSNFLSSYKIERKIKQKFSSSIKKLFLHIQQREKFYEIIREIISNLDSKDTIIDKDIKKDVEKKEEQEKSNKYDQICIDTSTIEEDITRSLDKLLIKSSPKNIKNNSEAKEVKSYINLRPDIDQKEISEYRVFTHKFDEVITPKHIMSYKEKKLLWNRLKTHLNKNIKNRSLNKFAVKLQTKQLQNKIPFQESGRLSLKTLPNIIINPNFRHCYQIDHNLPQYNHHVTFLLDNSGSMQGEPIMNTIIVTYHLCKLLEKFNISTEILGYTTKLWRGGESHKLWLKKSKPRNPGRVNDLRHVIYKSATDGVTQKKQLLALMLKDGFLKENIDGEALLWAKKRLKYNQAKKKNIVVISDGSPIDEVTLELNKKGILEQHLKEVIKDFQQKKEINLIGCGINYDVSKLYKNFINLANHNELNKEFIDKFCSLLF